ncbi:MAG: Uma2 family endonuclease [Oscillatoriales cyanobacterium RM1_1_9]|nr:Uma2 family endonuclease [Oscillatoriales cyanobacterium SM2_3_0]NJO46909.1 Uma2 family endonuclease [Oscillatoriales cyanobacterium RM2_1_1]NJO71805.1 Uma2 family endonuclease [Oscillatoriales cyanobacterium RM1_1_9]
MTSISTQKLTFIEFLERCPDGFGRYELVNGELIKVEPTRAHKNVARFLVRCFTQESDRLNLDYIVDKDIIIKTVTPEGEERGRNPDVGVVKAAVWNSNVRTYGALTESIQLAVEVVSTNWEDDYIDKLDEHQRLGIPEYWIVDYWAIGSRSFLGYPKQPKVFVHQLIQGEYQVQPFAGSDRIISLTFPELELTCTQVFASSQIQEL